MYKAKDKLLFRCNNGTGVYLDSLIDVDIMYTLLYHIIKNSQQPDH